METNNNNAVIAITEKTSEIYFLFKELSDFFEKVSKWNEKYNCIFDNEKLNASLQDEFDNEAYKAYSPFETFLCNLLKDSIENNIHEYDNTL